MSAYDLDESRLKRASPFIVHRLSEMAGKPIPERDWLIPSVLIRRSITLFAGDGGVGKSLMSQQLQVAVALGADWLGVHIPKRISSFGFYCEDDKDELDRRFHAICKHYGTTFGAVGEMISYTSRVGMEDNELVTFRGKTEYAKATRTATFDQVEYEVKHGGHELIILDTVSDVFAGNENIRYQVKAAVSTLRRLAIINNGGVVINAHPSKSAMLDGSGFSGSTAWNGAVRNRLYLSTPKKPVDSEDDGPTDERVLKVMKSNYGPFGEKIQCRWQDGVFVRNDKGPGSMLDRLETDARILKAAEYLIVNGNRLAAAHKARNGFVNLVRALPSCRDLSWEGLIKAQDRLVADGKLVKVEVGPPSDRYVFIRPPHMHYPGEKSS